LELWLLSAYIFLVSGNLIVGRYKNEFFQQYDNGKVATTIEEKINLHSIMAGVVPWLSSTQGFSRAIAQLLVHKLIPLVINIDNPSATGIEDSQWYLRSLFRFLDENPEMKRLRKKQEQFFQRYEVDLVCSPEGLFAIPVDEGQEANPIHMIEVIKECLQEVYNDANIDRAPLWKQIELATTADSSQRRNAHGSAGCDNEDVNFQRKIIPIDELNLAMDDIRDQKHRNRIGRQKQNLIVCATLIDKVPNLGGLARTSEIFAVHKLIVPNIQITKMDNFRNLCVGAADWIDIEECNEQVWLSLCS
jgi:tRNA guanosine-2'-O-methyltransferase